MSASQSASRHPFLVDRDQEHIRLLWIYHWVLGSLVALLWVLFYILPLVLGPLFYQALHFKMPASPDVLKTHLLTGLLTYGAQALVLGLNGWMLRQRKHWLSCVILSTITCLCVLPIGLILGVSAVLVLRRESVKALFRQAQLGMADSSAK